jgi:hypothetical protein
MDLLLKSAIAVVVIVALFAGLFLFKGSLFQRLSASQADSVILSYLGNSYPGASINVTNTTPSQFAGSWHILSSIITNPSSPCPSYYVYSFDYPKYNLVYRVENVYTDNCTIVGMFPGERYLIGSYPAAITRSYNLNVSSIRDFVGRYGYSDVVVKANYYNTTNIGGMDYHNVWMVSYSSPQSNHSVYVMLSQLNGTFVLSYNLTS